MSKAYEVKLRELARKHGRLTPSLVLKEAQSPKSPLHSFFEWDDGRAAEAYRLTQARLLIRSVEVTVHTEQIRIKAPVYVRDPDALGHEQGYIAVPDIVSDRERCRRALQEEIRRADAHLERAHRIAVEMKLSGDFDAIRAELAGLLTQATA